MGKSDFPTNLILNFFNNFDEIYTYSPSLHQGLYQKLFKCFRTCIPINIIPIFLNEKDIDLVGDEIINHKHFEKSDTKVETYE